MARSSVLYMTALGLSGSLRRVAAFGVSVGALFAVGPSGAYSTGIQTNQYSHTTTGCAQAGCHSDTSRGAPTVVFDVAPTLVLAGSTNRVRMRITSDDERDHGGCNIWASSGTLSPRDATTRAINPPSTTYASELTHTNRLTGGTNVYCDFNWQAPSTVGTATLNGWGNKVYFDYTTSPYDRPAKVSQLSIAVCRDADGDGYYSSDSPAACVPRDCNDNCATCNPGGVESCSNQLIDNDCDGDANELTNGITAGAACSTGNSGICSDGTYACQGSSVVCVQTRSPTTETCANYGMDDDCDGNASEIVNGVNLNAPCSTGLLGVCSAGTSQCVGGAATCVQTTAASAETCSNLNVDNDCDGDATEITNGVHEGDACSTGLAGVCGPGERACSGGQAICRQLTAASAERCDGLDNNCNSQLDEGCDDDGDDYCDAGMTTVGTPAVCPFGGGDCNDTSNVTRPGAPEICDGLDNDCDGTPDDNISASTCGLGICQRTAASCMNGVPQNCTPGTPGVESCANLGTDDDCDGDATELTNNVRPGDACSTGLPGICNAGTRACSGGVVVCSQTNTAGTETCANVGVDNDCDGDATELNAAGVHAGEPCTTGLPGVCSAGTWACQAGSVVCVPTVTASAETCLNQGVDNDCDGDATELTDGVHENDACTTGVPGECSAGRQRCTSGSLLCVPIRQAAPEVCDGRDNDCDGNTDNGLPNLTCGVGECANSVPACAGGTNNTCTPRAVTAETCDGRDNDCDGTVDEGCDDDNDDYCDAAMGYSGSSPACPLGGGDCDDTSGVTHPGAVEICDGVDNDCNGLEDDDVPEPTCGLGECKRPATGCVDGKGENCTPGPARAEVCDGLDNDCDGVVDNGVPLAACGRGVCARTGTTCAASSCTPGPSSEEVCDGLDNDCDGVVDNGIPLATCGVGACARTGSTCDPASCIPGGSGVEVCDGQDDDCNGVPDDGLPVSQCGQGECRTTGTSCLPSSCIPLDPTEEVCDGKDNDCDGVVDNGCDDDGDGWCDAALDLIESPVCPNGGGDCDDLSADSYPGALELCDGQDNDCDGAPDDDVTEAWCGVGACKALGTACVDGEAEDCSPGKPKTEKCDGVDNDCNGLIDDGLPTLRCGVGACAVEMVACRRGVPLECVPGEPEVESCDGVDNDCNGETDEGELCPNGLVCVAGSCQHFLSVGGGSNGEGGLQDTWAPQPLPPGGYGGADQVLGRPQDGGAVRDSGGCGCVVVGGSSAGAGWGLSALVALAWARRRRRAGSRDETNRTLSC